MKLASPSVSITVIALLLASCSTIAYDIPKPTISETSHQAGYMDAVQDDHHEKPHAHLALEECMQYTGEVQLTDSGQHLRPIQSIGSTSRTFFTYFHDINAAHVELKVVLNTEGRVEIFSTIDKMYRPYHTEVTLHASTYSPLYDYSTSESWAIGIQESKGCGIQTNLPFDRVSGFKIWY